MQVVKVAVTIMGNKPVQGEYPEVHLVNVDLETAISEYIKQYPDCTSVMITLVKLGDKWPE